MKITASALSLNVADEQASAQFARDHLGFVEEMANDGFVSLSRPDAGFNLVFLRTGLQTFKPEHLRGHSADGLLVVFVVDDIDGEYARLQSAGVPITTTQKDWVKLRVPDLAGRPVRAVRIGLHFRDGERAFAEVLERVLSK